CANAATISAFPFTDNSDTSTASGSPDPPTRCACGAGNGHSVWYTFVAPSDATITFDTSSSNYDTVVAAFTGSCDQLVEWICNDDLTSAQSQISLPVCTGQTYVVEVSSFCTTGGGDLVLNASLSPPPDEDGDSVEDCID